MKRRREKGVTDTFSFALRRLRRTGAVFLSHVTIMKRLLRMISTRSSGEQVVLLQALAVLIVLIVLFVLSILLRIVAQ